jgi:hypothetical protein
MDAAAAFVIIFAITAYAAHEVTNKTTEFGTAALWWGLAVVLIILAAGLLQPSKENDLLFLGIAQVVGAYGPPGILGLAAGAAIGWAVAEREKPRL